MNMNASNYIKKKSSSLDVVCWILDVRKTLVVTLICLFPVITFAQTQEDRPSPRGAFLRSLVVPGWGHYYVDNENWNRGKYHLAGEVVLVLSYFGLNARANYLETDYATLALSKAGADLSGKSREYIIAVGNYNTLSEYNNAQLRTRNWNRLFPETEDYQWNWENSDFRFQYQDTRERVDRSRGQLPTLVALMVSNRLLSGLSAFVQARNKWENVPETSFSYLNEFGNPGFTANLRFNF